MEIRARAENKVDPSEEELTAQDHLKIDPISCARKSISSLGMNALQEALEL